jgi:hypothetical protein
MQKTQIVCFIITTLTCLSSSSFAQQKVALNSSDLKVDADKVILVRSNSSPDKVKVDLNIPFESTYCAEYGTEMVYGRDASCGYDHHRERVCHTEREEPTCSDVSREVCGPNGCHSYPTRECTGGGGSHQVCSYEDVSVMRSCNHPVSVCIRHDVRTTHEYKRVIIKFKNASSLINGATEEFEVSGAQRYRDSGAGDFNLKVINAAKSYRVRTKERSVFTDVIKVIGE